LASLLRTEPWLSLIRHVQLPEQSLFRNQNISAMQSNSRTTAGHAIPGLNLLELKIIQFNDAFRPPLAQPLLKYPFNT
jgi:hypothetical protein